jgi:hypothetical protein
LKWLVVKTTIVDGEGLLVTFFFSSWSKASMKNSKTRFTFFAVCQLNDSCKGPISKGGFGWCRWTTADLGLTPGAPAGDKFVLHKVV